MDKLTMPTIYIIIGLIIGVFIGFDSGFVVGNRNFNACLQKELADPKPVFWAEGTRFEVVNRDKQYFKVEVK